MRQGDFAAMPFLFRLFQAAGRSARGVSAPFLRPPQFGPYKKSGRPPIVKASANGDDSLRRHSTNSTS
jgi:hypothetical protein